MLRWLIGTSLRSRGLVAVIGLAVIILGVVQLRDMPRDSLPEFSPPRVEVQTEALGLSAEEMEQLITVPLEQDLLNGVAFLDYIRSETVPGLSRIELTFQPGTDELEARQVVNERLVGANTGIPPVGGLPQMLQPRSSTSRVMMIRLSSDTESLIDLSVLARWGIRPALLSVPGVANVTAWGERDHQLQVRVDPAQLDAEGVTLDQVIRTTGNALWVSPLTFLEASTPGAGGFFDTPQQRLGVQHVQSIKTAQDLAEVVLEDDAGTAAEGGQRLGDVATVVKDHQPLIGDAVFADGNGILLVVEKLPEANTVEVTKALDDKLAELRPGLSAVDVDASFYRPADYIEDSDNNLQTALIIGAVLSLLALGALLFNLRAVAVSLFAVLVALAAGVLVLWARGETINAMVLAGLVLALVLLIDDAVVSADVTQRSLVRAEGEDAETSTLRRYAAAVLRSRRPLLYGTAIALVVLVPVFVLTGETGEFLPPIALSYLGAVVASMIVALTVAPALAMLLLPRTPREQHAAPAARWLAARADRLGSRLVHAGPGMVVGVVLVVLGFVLLPFLDRASSLVPEFKDRDVLVQIEGDPGTSLPAMRKAAAKAGRELRDVPGVGTVGGHVGRAILGDQAVDANSGELWVGIQSNADHDDTVAAIENVMASYPALKSSVQTYPRERIDSILRESDGVDGKDLTVRVFGENLRVLEREARKLSNRLAGIDGVTAPRVEKPSRDPAIEVEVDLDRARELGIKPGDVRRAAATVLSGLRVGFLFEDQKVFDVVVWGAPSTRESVDAVRALPIDLPDGEGQVRLDEVAAVREVQRPNVIERKDVSRAVDIGLDVEGRSVGSVASDVKDLVRSTAFPLEYHAELLGDYSDKSSDRWLFVAMSVAAAIAVLLVLQAAFRSWLLAFAVVIALLGALTGGVIAALIDGNLVTIGSLMAFLAMFGLATRQGLVFVERAQELRTEGDGTVGPELVRRTLHERMAPIVTTAVTVAVAFLPFLFIGGVAGGEIVSPMAAVIIGSLVTTTIVSLVVVPALYLRLGSRAEHGEDVDMLSDLDAAELDEVGAAPVAR